MDSAAAKGEATTTRKLFSRTTVVSILINAAPTIVWALLTDTTTMVSWNSTIVSVQGSIQLGEKIQLVSTLAPGRTFKFKVKEMVPLQKLTLGDAMGRRTYGLKEIEGQTLFEMTETIGGPLFPLFAKQIPDFDASFEQFASDLKKAAEA